MAIQPRDPRSRRRLHGAPRAALLPSAARVGPFVFFDHIGPDGASRRARTRCPAASAYRPRHGDLSVRGRDPASRQPRQRQAIRPGAINWMTAGSGIVHSERTPPALRAQPARALHGLQLRVGAAARPGRGAPDFAHYPAAALPELGARGPEASRHDRRAFGARSPVKTLSETVLCRCRACRRRAARSPGRSRGARAYIVSGGADARRRSASPSIRLLVLKPGRRR